MRDNEHMSQRFDVVVLGAGPGGYVAAIRAAQLGKSVAIVEEKYWGGVCLNVGCIPSKALLRNAELAQTFTRDADLFGISGEVSFDYGKAFDRSRDVADGRVRGVHFLMKKNKITEFEGLGTFTGPHSMSVAAADGTNQTVEFDHAIIATGSKVRMLPGVQTSTNVVTYEEQIMSRDLPSSMVVVGAGAIGMEFGYILRSFGVDVTMIEFLPRALPSEDVEVSKEITKAYKKLGINILTSTKVESVDDDGSQVTVRYTAEDGSSQQVTVDRVLVSIGFAPNVEGIGLDAAGVQLDQTGAIAIDQ